MIASTLRHLAASVLLFGATLAVAAPLQAAPSYPRNIEENLHLNYAPPCSICHEHGQTGDGTPIEPFAWSMRARGLTGERNTLSPALDADQSDEVDSDGDGIADVVELQNGTDVNSPANDCIIPSGTTLEQGQCTPGIQPSPSLGCSITHRSREATGGTAVFGLLGLAAAAWFRRRTRVVLNSLAILSFALALGCGSADPPLEVAEGVSLPRFQGKWYEIARLPRATQTDCNGTTAFYTQRSDGSLALVNQCNLQSKTGPLYTVSMTATVPDSNVPAKLALDVGGYTGDYWILEVGANYEYAVVGHPSRLYWWVLSRTPSLDASTMNGITDRAKESGFDLSQLLYTPQPPAGERDTLTTPEGPVPAPLTTGCSAASRRSAHSTGSAAGVWCLAFVLAAVRRRRRTRRGEDAARSAA